MHIDRYRSTVGIAMKPGRSRPDLGGLTTKCVVAWEGEGTNVSPRDYDLKAWWQKRASDCAGSPFVIRAAFNQRGLVR